MQTWCGMHRITPTPLHRSALDLYSHTHLSSRSCTGRALSWCNNRKWGWGDNAFNAGPSGGAPPHTPHLDRLAATGVIFTDFHTASPVCSPSRAGFMTGRDPARFRIHTALNGDWNANAAQDQADYLDPSVATVTRLLQDNGWRTGHFGKW